MVPLKIVLNVSRFKPAINLNRVLSDFCEFKARLKSFKFHLSTVFIQRLSRLISWQSICAIRTLLILYNITCLWRMVDTILLLIFQVKITNIKRQGKNSNDISIPSNNISSSGLCQANLRQGQTMMKSWFKKTNFLIYICI